MICIIALCVLCVCCVCVCVFFFFFFQAEDGIRDLVRSRGLGDVYERQVTVHQIQSGQYVLTPHVAFRGTPWASPAFVHTP